MQNIKEAAANAGASARAGFEKAKATVQGQADTMRANDPVEKEMAKERKQERKQETEFNKQQARHQNAQAKHTGGQVGYTAGGNTGAGYTGRSGATGYNTGYDNTGYAGDNRGGYVYSTTRTETATYPTGRDYAAADNTATGYGTGAPAQAGAWGTTVEDDVMMGRGGNTTHNTRSGGADAARRYGTGTGGNHRRDGLV